MTLGCAPPASRTHHRTVAGRDARTCVQARIVWGEPGTFVKTRAGWASEENTGPRIFVFFALYKTEVIIDYTIGTVVCGNANGPTQPAPDQGRSHTHRSPATREPHYLQSASQGRFKKKLRGTLVLLLYKRACPLSSRVKVPYDFMPDASEPWVRTSRPRFFSQLKPQSRLRRSELRGPAVIFESRARGPRC